MPTFTAIYGEQTVTIEVETGCLMGDAVVQTGLPLEQPCAGLGTCGKCKLLVEEGAMDPDPLEEENLSEGEIRLGNRLACRARVQSDTRVVLAPIVVYSNKIFAVALGINESVRPHWAWPSIWGPPPWPHF